MRSSGLKLLLLSFVVLFIGLASCTSGAGEGRLSDTTFLESGVKYIFLSKGNGPKVDSLSRVTTHINLIVGTDTIWSTYAEDQSEFAFDAKRTSLISGFDEVVMYAQEGDRLLAVIPPELGYGTEGSGVVPPNAILHFDIDFLKVERPKPFLADIMLQAFDGDNTVAMMDAYTDIRGDSINYRIETGEWYQLTRKLMEDNAFQAIVDAWEVKLAEEPIMGGYYYQALAYDSLGQTKKAIATLEKGFRTVADTVGTGFAGNYLKQLKSR